jgi:Protein of unknown function (DUF2934)
MANRIKTKPFSSTTPAEGPRTRRKRAPALAQGSSHDLIAREAYAIWEMSGRPSDRDVEHWLEAEQRLASQ